MCESSEIKASATAISASGPEEWARQRGAVMTEYVLMVSLILAVAAIAVGALGIGVNSLFLLFPN